MRLLASAYLAALRAHIPKLDVILGHFTMHAKRQKLITPGGAMDTREVAGRGKAISNANMIVKAAVPTWTMDPGPAADVFNAEEKGSDVNLAVHCLNDAWAGAADCLALLTNDSDLAEVMRIVSTQLGKKVLLLTPEGTRPSHALQRYAWQARTIRRSVLAANRLPSPVPGTTITKPATW